MGAAAEKLAAGDSSSSAPVSVETQLAVERFLYRQAEVLDEKRWEEWLALFTEDGHYWMPVSDDQEDGEGVPNIFWENTNMMKMRIRRNNHPQAHSQAPQNRLCHVVSNVIVESEEPNGDVCRAVALPLRGIPALRRAQLHGQVPPLSEEDGGRLPDRPPAGRSGQPRGALRVRHPVVAVTPPHRSAG